MNPNMALKSVSDCQCLLDNFVLLLLQFKDIPDFSLLY